MYGLETRREPMSFKDKTSKFVDKKYNFAGRLNTQTLLHLQDNIRNMCGNDREKIIMDGFEDVEVWMFLAEKRQKVKEEKGIEKVERRERVSEMEFSHDKSEGNVMFHKREDDELGSIGIQTGGKRKVERMHLR